jgi:hypothetical protein
MVAPVGQSKRKDRVSPAALVNVPTAQAITSCLRGDVEKSTPMAAGMMRIENTKRTPAIATELVTTSPNVA